MRSVALFLFVLFASRVLAEKPGKYRGNNARISSAHRYSEHTRFAKAHIVQHSIKSRIIVAPSLPIKFKGLTYYWYGHYVYNASHPMKCEYNIDERDEEFETITFYDGSKPISLQFGCLTYEECCALECCGDSRSSTVLICVAFLIFLAIYWMVKMYRNAKRKRASIQVAAPSDWSSVETHHL